MQETTALIDPDLSYSITTVKEQDTTLNLISHMHATEYSNYYTLKGKFILRISVYPCWFELDYPPCNALFNAI